MKPFVIGIAGGSASGKSTFTHELISVLLLPPAIKVKAVSTDGYFWPDEKMPQFFSPTRQCRMPDYNHPESIDLQGLISVIDEHLVATHQEEIVIIEGLMVLFHPELRERCDLRIFIELDPDQRALRRLIRNIGTENDPLGGVGTPETIANYFLESAKIGHERYVEPSRKHADLILRGDGNFSRTARMVSEIIRANLKD